MRLLTFIFLSALLLVVLSDTATTAGWNPWGPPVVLEIDEENYTSADFQSWWSNWKEEDMVLPQTMTPYVDWLLLFKEAERMKLYEAPVYRKKVLTFLKARTLMYLKAEEIDSKINLTDEELWSQYEKTHTPRYQLNLFFFKEEAMAEAFVEKFGKTEVSDEEFATLHGREDGYFSQRTAWYRQTAINPGWLPILSELGKGEISRPISWKSDFVVIRQQNKLPGDATDFHHVKGQIKKALWKKEEDRLTIALLERLREKYKVEIDMERLAALELDSADGPASDTPLILTSNGNISQAVAVAKMRQVQRFRHKNGFKVTADLEFKMSVVNGIIDQTLTSWESLARGYEKKPPFENVYKFYCQHRMIKLLEEKVFIPQAKVAGAEIESFYRDNKKRFTEPEIIRMAIVEGSEDELQSLWLEVTLGGDFLSLAHQLKGHAIPVREIPGNHLNKQVREVVEKLTENEVSRVFSVDGHYSLVQLVNRKPSRLKRLEEVKKSIEDILFAEKLATERQSYLSRLKETYAVELHANAWTKLREDMEQKDETDSN